MEKLRKGRELIGLSVVELNSGKNLGEIKDILYSPVENKVMAFLIADNGWFWGAKVLPYEEALYVGRDMVMVSDAGKIHNTKYHSDYNRMYQDRIDIRGCQLISGAGEIMGTIQDIIINPAGRITGYELSNGVIDDILKGRKVLAVPDNMVISDDVVIVTAGTNVKNSI
ncbi:PRC-barrel domain-containing protein [Thermincola ferriacetica]